MCVKYVILEILHKLYHKQSDLNMRFKAAQNSILFSFLVFSFFSCSYKQQQVLFENTARAMGDAPQEIKLRHIENCKKADEAYGKGVAQALGIKIK